MKKLFLYIEDQLNRLFSPKYNPFYYLGAISTLFFLILLISGIYLFIFYRTNNPYKIVQDLTEKQWYLGGIMRSLHRYASDGLVISIVLHTIREYVNGRYSHYRWIAWVSGVVLFIVSLMLGISGYWLVWDERAQLIALKTAELLNDIFFFMEPPSRSFLSNESISGMFFFLLHFLHVALPLGMIVLIGIHIIRCPRPVLKTPRAVTAGVAVALLIASIILPATSAQPADLTRLPINTPFDWFFFFIYPVRSLLPKSIFWLITIGGTIILFILPWTKRHRLLTAQVTSENCTGCDQCNKDCPYGAIRLQPPEERFPYRLKAVIMPERCAACGICVGACDFNAINLPEMTETQIKEEIIKLLAAIQTDRRPRILLLVCKRSVRFDAVADIIKERANIKAIALPCIGMVQPSMIETGFKSGAGGIFLCGCIIGDCHYREGNVWLQARLRGERPPFSNKMVDCQRIREYWLSSINTTKLAEELRLFEENLNAYNISVHEKPRIIKSIEDRRWSFKRVIASAIPAFLLPAFLILFLSTKPIYPFYSKDKSLIKFTFKHSSKHIGGCRELTKEEIEALPMHMRKTNSPFPSIRMDCGRERFPVYVEVDLDDKNVLSKIYYPAGLRNDGPVFAYEEIPVVPGIHEIKVRMGDSKEGLTFDYTLEEKIDIKARGVVVIDLSTMLKSSL